MYIHVVREHPTDPNLRQSDRIAMGMKKLYVQVTVHAAATCTLVRLSPYPLYSEPMEDSTVHGTKLDWPK